MDKGDKDPQLRNLKELFEMYLSSQLLFNEIFAPLKIFLKESEINAALSEKTGKIPNSIYRDKNTSISFSTVTFLRYWNALLQIYDEHEQDKDQLPTLNDLVKKYKEVITAVSQVEGEISLEEAVNNHFQLTVEVVSYYERNPISPTKKPKLKVLNLLKKRSDIQQALLDKQIQKRKERMNKID
ncbi:hypothetical protein J6TS1_39800 [Siminovitchia terrae]|uniref:Uncharacterized protein n=1 Tax=Siminovitchia terrae TaxID=1914933 RepID=A0ABQ4L1G5_SIMTE|nr:hypothetical protein [Siminovitchia terrae]GIN98110.1 hypothetical protein J6TS1_39800 [Siminovitchia terrae]